jgi:hypothetical protein
MSGGRWAMFETGLPDWCWFCDDGSDDDDEGGWSVWSSSSHGHRAILKVIPLNGLKIENHQNCQKNHHKNCQSLKITKIQKSSKKIIFFFLKIKIL